MQSLATIGGGCFWCLETFYRRINGVTSVTSGYSGGTLPNPTDKDVYRGGTGHAEVIQLSFDPSLITYREILEIFFVMHDPTTLNRQGIDVGEIYRSIIFYHNEEQREIAADMINNYASELWKDPVVTQLEKFEVFYPAGASQQDFYNSGQRPDYCMMVIDPKIQKLRAQFASKLKPDK